MSCICGGGNSNSGILSCRGLMGVGRKLIVVQKYNSLGVRNSIDVTGATTIDQAFFDALVNQADVSKRFYPLPLMDNIEDVKGDSLKETLNSNEELFISEGIRTFTGVMVEQSAKFLSVLKSMRCTNNAVYIIDKGGKLIGELSDDGTLLYPIDVSQATWDPKLMKTTDATVQKIMLDFAFAPETKDENLNFIAPSEMDDIDLLTLNGLWDISGTFVSSISTKTIVTLEFLYGSAMTKQKVNDLLVADWELYNTTTSLAVTVDTSTESDGTYTLNHAAGVTAADVLTLKVDKDGFSNDTILTITVS